jgi:hypothetical protein
VTGRATKAGSAGDGLHDFTDRALRDLLSQPDNLRDFLGAVIPNSAAGFDVDRMREAPQEFLLGNWRREPDLLFEIPYRTGETDEAWVLVCVLIEHQTKSDWQVPLKTFVYAAAYWEWQWRAWEEAPAPKPDFALTPVLPLVLHTGPRPWGSPKTLPDLLAPPAAFQAFAPDWQPVFWELATHSTDELLNGEAAFLQALTILKADDAARADAEELFKAVFRHIDPLHEARRPRWENLLRFLLGWAHFKRPAVEWSAWRQTATDLQAEADQRRETETMGQTIAEAIFEEGETKGRQEGRQEGERRHAQMTLIRFARKRLGEPNQETQDVIDRITDLDRLERMLDRHDQAVSWADLIATP